MADLSTDFERKAREALLDDAEDRLYAEPDNLAFNFLTEANANLNAYGDRNDYHTESVADSGHVAETERTNRMVKVTLLWDHAAAGIFQTGTSRHQVEGDPLAFEWPDAPAEIREQFADTFPTVFFQSVEVEGIPASRFVRNTIEWFRNEVRNR